MLLYRRGVLRNQFCFGLRNRFLVWISTRYTKPKMLRKIDFPKSSFHKEHNQPIEIIIMPRPHKTYSKNFTTNDYEKKCGICGKVFISQDAPRKVALQIKLHYAIHMREDPAEMSAYAKSKGFVYKEK